MKIVQDGETLHVGAFKELAAANAEGFQSEIQAASLGTMKQIAIDLSQTAFVDCRGLGALMALRNRASWGNGKIVIHLVDPRPSVRRLLEVTRLDGIFLIEKGRPARKTRELNTP